jgi:hypothetical protein
LRQHSTERIDDGEFFGVFGFDKPEEFGCERFGVIEGFAVKPRRFALAPPIGFVMAKENIDFRSKERDSALRVFCPNFLANLKPPSSLVLQTSGDRVQSSINLRANRLG